MIKAIIACDRQGGIAHDGALPWPKNTEDLKYFSTKTKNNVVVMGSGTWHSKDMPVPLPNRLNAVVSSKNLEVQPDIILNSDRSEDLIKLIQNLDQTYPDKDVWIIGGAKLLMSVAEVVEELHLTMMKQTYTCDTFIDVDRLFELFKISEYTQFGDHDRFLMHRYIKQHNKA